MRLDLLFRSCARVYAVHGGKRPVEVDKGELLLTCLLSLIESAHFALSKHKDLEIRLRVFDDHSRPEITLHIQKILKNATFATSFESLQETGNGNSLKATYLYARSTCPDWVFFIEDDYLFSKNCLSEMMGAGLEMRNNLRQEVALCPVDYPERYTHLYPSYLVFTGQRHWRSIQHTCGTMMTSASVLKDQWEHFWGLTRYGEDPLINEDNTINRVYQKVPCFCPIPSLAAHLEGQQMPFAFDWRSIWKESYQTMRSSLHTELDVERESPLP